MADISKLKIAFICFGNMASAMADGWIKSGQVPAAHLGAASRRFDVLKAKTDARGMTAFETNEVAARWADVVVIAVKPYLVKDVVTPLKAILAEKVVLSVAVNLLFDDYEALLAPGTQHLSTLPNTPVAVCEGIVVCERRHSLSEAEWQSVQALLSHVGLVIPVDTAKLGIAGTVCGCGPAFVAMFIEALDDAVV